MTIARADGAVPHAFAHMIFVTKFGPIPVGRRLTNSYVAFTDGGLALPPVVGTDDAAALRQIRAGRSGPYLCDETLAQAGMTEGFMVASVPHELIEPVAQLALSTTLGAGVDPTAIAALVPFASAAAAFAKSEPWELWHSDQVLSVTLTGSIAGAFELSIMGSGGREFGLMLYDEPGVMNEVIATHAQGLPVNKRRLSFRSFGFEDDPTYVIRALNLAFDLDDVPVPMRVAHGEAVPLASSDILAIAAVARAASALGPARRDAKAVATCEGLSVTAEIRAPAPARHQAA